MMIETTLSPQVLSTLRQTPEILEKMLEMATEEAMLWKPAPERWSISEVLGHLNHVEREIYRSRLQRFLDEEDYPLFEAYDTDAKYAEGLYSGEPGRVQLKRFAGERWHSLAMLYQFPAGAEQRVARHARFGRITLDTLLHEWAYHDLGHVRQIAELYRAFAFYPSMGGYREFYKPQP
ncbi:MAG: DinB family protein [Acidobacteriota bacterium]|nr:DinB family protein [Acidobacteriota bacterium]